MAKEKILLSACLAGVNCVYDGTNKFHPLFASMVETGQVLIFCPEVLGGLKIPHDPSEITGGDGFACLLGKAKVVSKKGENVTPFFLKGADRVLALAEKHNARKAIMKSKSPSCGCGFIFDGTFSGKLIQGYGVTAAILKKSGIEVISDTEYLERMEEKQNYKKSNTIKHNYRKSKKIK